MLHNAESLIDYITLYFITFVHYYVRIIMAAQCGLNILIFAYIRYIYRLSFKDHFSGSDKSIIIKYKNLNFIGF